MDEQLERRPSMSAKRLSRLILNLLTLLILLATLIVGIEFFITFINPYRGLNPYPPPTMPPTLGAPTPTNTPAVSLPTAWTPTTTSTLPVTETPTPTLTPTGTPQPDATETPVAAEMPFALQIGSPARIQNFIDIDAGCDWMGIGGQVFSLEGDPIIELTVHLAGELEGLDPIDLYAITGSAPDLGPGGYLFVIADSSIASENTLWIQLDDGSGNPLSDAIYLETSDSCAENLVLVHWRQVREP